MLQYLNVLEYFFIIILFSNSLIFRSTLVSGKIPSLTELCVFKLQENVDSIIDTRGLKFNLLEPILARAKPETLMNIENYNPYLTESTGTFEISFKVFKLILISDIFDNSLLAGKTTKYHVKIGFFYFALFKRETLMLQFLFYFLRYAEKFIKRVILVV